MLSAFALCIMAFAGYTFITTHGAKSVGSLMCDVEALTRGEDESQDNKWTPTAYNQECCVRWETVVVNGVNQRVCVDHKTRSGVSCLSGSSKCTPVAACPEG